MVASILKSPTIVSPITHSSQQPGDYHLAKSIPVAGEGGWDLISVDSNARRVYVAHSTKADVIDADSGEVLGAVAPLSGAHGVGIAPGTGYGFATGGKTDTVSVFSLKTLEITGEIKTGKKPDAIIYDPATKRVFAFNADGHSATVFDASMRQIISSAADGTLIAGPSAELNKAQFLKFILDESANQYCNLLENDIYMLILLFEGTPVFS